MPVITPRIFERLLAAFQTCIEEVSNSTNIDSLRAVFLVARALSEAYHDELILNGISHVLMRKLDLFRNTIVQKEQSEARDFLRGIVLLPKLTADIHSARRHIARPWLYCSARA